jgi:hypothetical protein
MGSVQIRAWQQFLFAALAVVLVVLPAGAQTPLACGDSITNALDTIGHLHGNRRGSRVDPDGHAVGRA